MPEVSVLMSVYNAENYLCEAIESILNQTYQDFEFIIINDGSTDNSLNVIRSYASDKRIKVYNLEGNGGLANALNFGLEKVSGKYVARQDADDISHVDRLGKQKDILDKRVDISLVDSFVEYFPSNSEVGESERYKFYKSIVEKDKNRPFSPEEIREKLYWYCCITHGTIMARREVITPIGYDGSFRVAEDYKLFYRLNKLGYKTCKINEVLLKIRVSSSSNMAKYKNLNNRMIFQIKEDEIRNLYKERQPLIWGAGSAGLTVLEILKENGLDIEGFLDSGSDKQGTQIQGRYVYSPDILKDRTKGYKVLIASSIGKFQINELLKSWGYRHLEDFVVYF
ncbi:glycosyltransferase [Phosphitispora fastidiosa]|uniref:glycosyltransferase n=1 Tax=Phosphitispora fastidiosa TaxID=2837202 RepID=UPI001E2B12D1|nr:glycosyltransferase [Phosphitispora fastidiosa]MBU7006390.1 glycosyltransferase involved in cell wall biosynthesis [Phosphitispora fastidiosa]